MVQVYSTPLRDRYYAPACSVAVFVNVLYYAALLLVPFWLAYAASALWIKNKTYFEQPSIEYRREAILQAQGIQFIQSQSTTTQQVTSRIATRPTLDWSTFSNYNALLQQQESASAAASSSTTGASRLTLPLTVTHSTTDSNQDGIADQIDGTFTFALPAGTMVNQCTLWLQLSCELTQRVKVRQVSLMRFQHSSPIPGREWSIKGDLIFTQLSSPLPYSSVARSAYATPVVSNYNFSTSASAMNMGPYLSQAWRQNETIHCRSCDTLSTWSGQSLAPQPAPASPSALDLSLSPVPSFSVVYSFRIPVSSVVYTPGPGETLVWALVSYLSLLWLLHLVLSRARRFIFVHNLTQTATRRDTIPINKLHSF